MDYRDLMEKIIRILGKTYYGDVRLENGRSFGVGKNKSEENIHSGRLFYPQKIDVRQNEDQNQRG